MDKHIKITIESDKFITFGSCLAMIISYVKYKSIKWAILHGILNWLYVAYYIIKFGIN